MSKIVSLSSARKQKARAEKRRTGHENARKFGQTKAERSLGTARSEKATRDLDGHERE